MPSDPYHWLVLVALKALVILPLVLLAVWASRRTSASVISLLLACAVIYVPLSPFLDGLLPHITLTIPFLKHTGAFPDNIPVLEEFERNNPMPANPAEIIFQGASSINPGDVILAIWLLGALVLLVTKLWRSMNTKLWFIGSRPVADGECTLHCLKRLCSKMGIKREPWLMYNSRVHGAQAVGILRPVILLPEGFSAMPKESREMVLIHELEHIRRKDVFGRLCLELISVLFWFHPCFWITLRRYNQKSEMACDDAVLNAGYSAAQYGEVLLAEGKALAGTEGGVPKELKPRVKYLLNKATDRHSLSKAARMKFFALFMLALVPMGLVSFSPYDDELGFETIAPTEGLKAVWRLNLGRGNIVVDSSGGGHHGRINGASWVNDPERGDCLSLDGVDDFITFRAPDADWTTKDFTFCVWLKPASGSDGGGLLLRGEFNQIWSKGIGTERTGAINYAEREIILAGPRYGPNKYFLYDPGLLPSFNYFGIGTARSTVALQEDEWMHLAMVWKIKGNEARTEMYLNGEPVEVKHLQRLFVTDLSDWPTKTWMFGVSDSPIVRGNNYEGCVSDLAIYQKALSQEEVQMVKKGNFSLEQQN
ncbi:Signal transducer regulating beta-lactamase production, contains metallopeptidase domain [Rubritalea squalenifaciens DSM 18772]|uniref:Signal transducer regulating beta-lactamase production, contains metallopeptidase domain n=1 Tax=Rubritalea squalenifaciens DSM 18772 TaxID=1123071 RepID=A0A1M6E5N3_9BACT|nr:Signal transducer regulating beta-lactamase production, contains metallopeptidase domain [Rubritalea squalenifaciens DSM 18772]